MTPWTCLSSHGRGVWSPVSLDPASRTCAYGSVDHGCHGKRSLQAVSTNHVVVAGAGGVAAGEENRTAQCMAAEWTRPSDMTFVSTPTQLLIRNISNVIRLSPHLFAVNLLVHQLWHCRNGMQLVGPVRARAKVGRKLDCSAIVMINWHDVGTLLDDMRLAGERRMCDFPNDRRRGRLIRMSRMHSRVVDFK